MTTSWCIPLYTFLHRLGICKAQKTLIEAFEPMRTFAKGVIAQAQPNKEGNFIEQHMEEIKGAKPGSRLYTLHSGLCPVTCFSVHRFIDALQSLHSGQSIQFDAYSEMWIYGSEIA